MTNAPLHDDTRDPALPEGLATLLREHAGADRPLEDGETGVDVRVDDAVMSAARERLAEIEPPKTLRFPMLARVIAGASVAAAAIGLVVFFGPGTSSPPAPANSQSTSESQLALAEEQAAPTESFANLSRSARSDFARSAEAESFAETTAPLASLADASLAFGQPNTVTIRDAYTLALAIEGESDIDASLDANRDGRVDRADVESLATRAVALGDRVSALPFTPPPAPWSERFLGAWTLAHLTGSVLP